MAGSEPGHGESYIEASGALIFCDRLMMANDFLDDEVEELLREIRIQLGVLRQLAQPRDLGGFPRRISGRKVMGCLELAHCLSALEPFRQHMDQRRVDIVDAI